MRVQCPECGFLRPAGADACPSCGAAAPAPAGGARSGSGTSLRQWKERYQTGHLPGVPSGPAGTSMDRPLTRRTSGPITAGQGQSNPDWGNESPANSIPPGAGLGIRRSGSLTPPPGTLPPTRRSGGFSSPAWPSATDATPPPPGRSSGLLNNPTRTGGSDAGNGSASWRWKNQGASGGVGLGNQTSATRYDDPGDYQDDTQDAQPFRPSGRLRDESMLPVPYQSGRRPWGQAGGSDTYDGMDEQGGSSPDLPATFGMERDSRAFPALMDDVATNLPPGRKPPAFIPATRPRRPYRLSNYRIISGTISIAIVLLLVGGGLGFLVVQTHLLQRVFASNQLPAISNHFGMPPTPANLGTPQPSNNPAATIIVKVITAKNYTGHYDPINPTSTFQTGQTVNVLWQVRPPQAGTGFFASDSRQVGTTRWNVQLPQGANTISIQWYLDGNAIMGLDPKSTQESIPDNTSFNGLFALCYPTSGVGMAQLYWNNQLAQTIEFLIIGNSAQCN